MMGWPNLRVLPGSFLSPFPIIGFIELLKLGLSGFWWNKNLLNFLFQFLNINDLPSSLLLRQDAFSSLSEEDSAWSLPPLCDLTVAKDKRSQELPEFLLMLFLPFNWSPFFPVPVNWSPCESLLSFNWSLPSGQDWGAPVLISSPPLRPLDFRLRFSELSSCSFNSTWYCKHQTPSRELRFIIYLFVKYVPAGRDKDETDEDVEHTDCEACLCVEYLSGAIQD